MRHSFVLLPFFALTIASCGDADSAASGEKISGAEGAERASTAVQPQAGQYRATMEVLEVSIPGAPASATDMMKKAMGGHVVEYCLKPEDAKQGYEKMAKQSQKGDCTFSKFNVIGGKIDAEMTCQAQNGAMTMMLDGTATPTKSVMNMTMTGNMSGTGQSTIRMKTTHERVGDCKS